MSKNEIWFFMIVVAEVAVSVNESKALGVVSTLAGSCLQ